MTVPIPATMAHLERDARGLPVPFIVLRDTAGRPHFTVNNDTLRIKCLYENLCGICGKRLHRGRWFVGGPLSAFDPHGFYVDPPMHAECARYALQVCPYLAAPHYGRSIAGKTFTPEEQAAMQTGLVEFTMLPERPPLFVAVMAVDQKFSHNVSKGGSTNMAMRHLQVYVRPVQPYRTIEYWQHGKQLPAEIGLPIVARAVLDFAANGRETNAVI